MTCATCGAKGGPPFGDGFEPSGLPELRAFVLDLAPLLSRSDEIDPILSAEERTRAGRFIFEADRRRFRAARWALRRILGERLGVPPAEVAFRILPGGKPALAPPFDGTGVRFNLSHSGDLLLVALADGREVGADVERAREDLDWPALSARFLPAGSVATLAALAPAEGRAAFFRAWTLAEALGKAAGVGLAIHDERHRETLAALAARPPGEPFPLEWSGRKFRLLSFEPRPGFAGALAVEEGTSGV